MFRFNSWAFVSLLPASLPTITKSRFLEIALSSNQLLLEEMLEKSAGRKTVPQIFIGNFHVGGCDDLYALNEKGELDTIINAATSI